MRLQLEKMQNYLDFYQQIVLEDKMHNYKELKDKTIAKVSFRAAFLTSCFKIKQVSGLTVIPYLLI